MQIKDFFYIITVLSFFILLLEMLYSFYRKDGIYTAKQVSGNMLHWVILRIFTRIATKINILFFIAIMLATGTKNVSFNTLSFVSCLILVDFIYYLVHRVHHSLSFFWTFHFVHHSDNHLNLTTSFRVSWIEILYFNFLFTPILLLGFTGNELLLALSFLGSYQFYCHSQYIKLPKIFNFFLITPDNHRIHHDQIIKNQKH